MPPQRLADCRAFTNAYTGRIFFRLSASMKLGQTPSRQAQFVWPSGDFKHGSVMSLTLARRYLPGPQTAHLGRRSGSCRRKPQAGEDARVLRSSEWDTLLRAAAQSIRSTIATRPESALRRECRTELKRMRTISN